MPDLTWLGWIFFIDMSLSVFIHLFRATNGDYIRTAGDSAVLAVVCVLYVVGFLTIGFVH